MQSHPDYPALVSLTDTLEELKITFEAIRVEKDFVHKMSFPLLAHTLKNHQEEFEKINSISEITPSFYKNWDGIVFLSEKVSNK